MKKLPYFISGILSFLVACKSNRNCCTVLRDTTSITAKKNGAAWAPGFTKITVDNTDTLTIGAKSTLSKNDSVTNLDSLRIKVLFISIGGYKLLPKQIFYATYFSKDSLTKYQVDTLFNNVLNVTGYQVINNADKTNPNQVKITGTFNLRFVDPKNAAGINFSGGSFLTVQNQ